MRKTKPEPASPRQRHRLLTLSAAILLLPAAAWSDNISNVLINGTAADSSNDVIPTSYDGGLGSDNGLIIKGGTTPTSGNRVQVTDTPTHNSDTKYGVAGGGGIGTDAASNEVDVIKGTVSGSVVGGVSAVTSGPDPVGGNATANRVTINTTNGSDGDAVSVGKDVIGGASQQGHAERNTVTIVGGDNKTVTVSGDIYGGAADTSANSTYSGGNASNNDVTLTGNVAVTGVVRGGGTSNGDANSNHVTIGIGSKLRSWVPSPAGLPPLETRPKTVWKSTAALSLQASLAVKWITRGQ